MGLLSIIASPLPRIQGKHSDKHSDSSSDDFVPVETTRRRKEGVLPGISNRWKRNQSDDHPNRKKDKDSISPFGRVRSLFVQTPRASDEYSGPPSARSARLDPLGSRQLNSPVEVANGHAGFRANLFSRTLSHATLAIDPADSPVFEIVPGKLHVATHETPAHTRAHMDHRPDLFFFTSDLHRIYGPGGIPVNIGAVFRFWEFMQTEVSDYRSRGRQLVYYTDDNCWESTAVFLLACYMVLEHKMSTEAVVSSLSRAFSDAHLDSDTLLGDYLDALRKAAEKSWLKVDGFNVDEYVSLGDPSGGGLSCFGNDFIVFPTPADLGKPGRRGSFSSVYYSNILQRMGATAVVRINDPASYDNHPFTERRIEHFDLTFDILPTKTTVRDFLDICDRQQGMVGVHGIDGMGGSCALVCLWAMKHLDFSAKEAMAWVRLVRPGAINLKQEMFLLDAEAGGWNGNWLMSTEIQADDDLGEDLEEEDSVRHWGRTPRLNPVAE